MKGNWVAMLRGYAVVKLVGGNPEAFLNGVTKMRIVLWDIAFTSEKELRFGVSLPDFFRLRPIARDSGGKLRVLKRHGLPFKLARLSRRKTFASGLLGFVLLLFILSTFIWDVKVTGETAIPENKILQAAKAEGLHPYQWSFRLPDTSELAKRLSRHLPDASWVGVEKKGTKVVITVVDATKPDKKPLEGPRDLVAGADAVITRVIAENGRPQVERHDRVRKGQVLISGLLGDGGAHTKAVVSKGTVMGLVWHEYNIVSPLKRQVRTLTGESKERTYWIIGNRGLQVSGYGGEPFADSEIRATASKLRLGRWQLPFGVMNERELEAAVTETSLTEAEAKEAGLAQARKELLAKSGPGARITSENLLHEQTENGKVRMTILFEVEQSIAVERPLIQLPVDQGE
ncbi:sporulation protein YqfD [Cohnella faecalis]|nr:sporulation protein YqfD [Cohnella faecalis]